MVKKEFDQALSEIRRVFIIDDRDRFAREFELKILQMQELQRRKPIVSAAAGSTTHTGSGPPGSSSSGSSRRIPLRQRSGMSLAMKIAILLAVAFIAFAGYYFWKREQPRP